MDELDAFYAFLVAAAVAGVLTPLVARVARRVGAVDRPRERGLSARETPLLGGLAILAGVLAAGTLFLPGDDQTRAILAAAALITVICAPCWTFRPASAFMANSATNLLGLLLGCIAVQGTLKTNALIALVGPLVILAVPFLDGGFVVAKRLKYRRRPWTADPEHFHHRLARIGFSQRRTVLYLYGWTFALAGLAVALRFIPYSDHHGNLPTGWTIVVVALGLLAIAASVYLVYVLEILKFTRRRAAELRAEDPATSEHEIAAAVEREFGTGEFEAVPPER